MPFVPTSLADVLFLTGPVLDCLHTRKHSLMILEERLNRQGFDLFAYTELFERYVAESLISIGHDPCGPDEGTVTLRNLPLGPIDLGSVNLIGQVLGLNSHGNVRYNRLAELFALYDESDPKDFFREALYLKSEYFREDIASESPRQGLGILKAVTALRSRSKMEAVARDRVRMLNHFRSAQGSLVPDSKASTPSSSFSYYDFPWAIDYFGYVKLRDGAHRRATLWYLGQKEIPTLVVDFSVITRHTCVAVSQTESVAEYFDQFYRIVSTLASCP